MTRAELREPLLPLNGKAHKTGHTKVTNGHSQSSKVATVLAFICFVAVRSFHPIIVDMSKTDGKLPYAKASPCVINSAVDIVIGNLIAFMFDGMQGIKQCWDPTPLKVFSAIACLYAIGDFLEMQSLAVMGGAVYQILLQSKLLITALIIWAIRGQRQSLLQWNTLATIAIGMSVFVLSGDSASKGDLKLSGLFFVLLKVFFSCLCAVLAEKYLKGYKSMPIYCQVAQLKFAWLWVSLLLVYVFDGDVSRQGLFAGWDGRTRVVALSWVCKGWSTFLVLKQLDSVLKNIGEAVAILVIYLFDIIIADAVSAYLPVQGKDFELSNALLVMVIVLTVGSYTLAPPAPKRVC